VSTEEHWLDDDYFLGEAREWLWERWEAGVKCPCCNRWAKVYRRALPAACARVMIALFQYKGWEGREYVHLPTELLDHMTGTAAHGGSGTEGRHWGLMEQAPGLRPDGSNRMGYWRLTALGRDFVNGNACVPKYAVIYGGECLRLEGREWWIFDALGRHFNYQDLMAGV